MIARLIDKTDILKFREISKSVRDAKINPYIDDAQNLDLRPMLGRKLYFDLVENRTDPKYIKLMEGGVYQFKGEDYYFAGLERVLSILTYARYILFGSGSDTPFGYVNKSGTDSTPVPVSTKRDIYTEDRRAASEYFQDVANFLDRNPEDYPLWESSSTCGPARLSNFRISKIG